VAYRVPLVMSKRLAFDRRCLRTPPEKCFLEVRFVRARRMIGSGSGGAAADGVRSV